MAGVRTEVWAKEIAANIFPDDSFMAYAINDDQWVNEDVVNLPQSGAIPGTTMNRSSFPGTITERTDAIVSYSLNSFTADPQRLRFADELTISYDKRKDMLEDYSATLQNQIARYLISIWAPSAAGQIVASTGAARVPSANFTNTTGTRKALTRADLISAQLLLDNQDVPRQGRVALITPQMHADLLADNTLTSKDYQDLNNLQEGAIVRALGMNIMLRSYTGVYPNGSTTAKAPTAAIAASDTPFGLIWHPRFVRRALGSTKVNYNKDVAEHYGDIMSAESRAGGSRRYTNGRGVVAIVETWVS